MTGIQTIGTYKNGTASAATLERMIKTAGAGVQNISNCSNDAFSYGMAAAASMLAAPLLGAGALTAVQTGESKYVVFALAGSAAFATASAAVNVYRMAKNYFASKRAQ